MEEAGEEECDEFDEKDEEEEEDTGEDVLVNNKEDEVNG